MFYLQSAVDPHPKRPPQVLTVSAWPVQQVNITATLDFQRTDFGFLRDVVDRVTWEVVLKGKAVQEGWTFFKNEIQKAQEHAILNSPRADLTEITSLSEQRAFSGTQGERV